MHVQQALLDAVDAGDRMTVTGIYRLLDNGSDELTVDTYLDRVGIEPGEIGFEDIDLDEYAAEIERIASGELGDCVAVLVENVCPEITGTTRSRRASSCSCSRRPARPTRRATASGGCSTA